MIDKMREEFEAAMKGRHYGTEETADALAWFSFGWQAALYAAPQWVSVEDRLPALYEEILFLWDDDTRLVPQSGTLTEYGWYADENRTSDNRVKFWMPSQVKFWMPISAAPTYKGQS